MLETLSVIQMSAWSLLDYISGDYKNNEVRVSNLIDFNQVTGKTAHVNRAYDSCESTGTYYWFKAASLNE